MHAACLMCAAMAGVEKGLRRCCSGRHGGGRHAVDVGHSFHSCLLLTTSSCRSAMGGRSLIHRSNPFCLTLCSNLYWRCSPRNVASSMAVNPKLGDFHTLHAVLSAASRKILITPICKLHKRLTWLGATCIACLKTTSASTQTGV